MEEEKYDFEDSNQFIVESKGKFAPNLKKSHKAPLRHHIQGNGTALWLLISSNII